MAAPKCKQTSKSLHFGDGYSLMAHKNLLCRGRGEARPGSTKTVYPRITAPLYIYARDNIWYGVVPDSSAVHGKQAKLQVVLVYI